MSATLLEVSGLTKHFPITKGFFGRRSGLIRAVENVSFDLSCGDSLGLVGESGCGKTTLVRTLLRAYEPTSGEILLHVNGQIHNLARLDRRELRPLRPHFQMIFQDPFSSLNPRMTVERIVCEPLKVNGVSEKKERRERVADMLERCGLDRSCLSRYPHAFSGGQRQRIGIARALVLKPELLVADEAVSALDVSVQAQILNLLHRLQQDFNLTYIFIAHNLGVVRHSTNRLAVMYCGVIVETGPTRLLCDEPRHPYTRTLLSAEPFPDPGKRMNRLVPPGEVADPANPPSGCKFHPRCSHAQEPCRCLEPKLKVLSDGRSVACHRVGQT